MVEALQQYDKALDLASSNESKQGEILLGRGYSILNSRDEKVLEDTRLRLEAVQNLEHAKAISVKNGNERAAAFVQQIIDKEGKLHVHDHDHDGEGCCSSKQDGTGERGGECSSHDVVARTAALRAAAAGESVAKDGTDQVDGIRTGTTMNATNWTKDLDERLISIIAKLGVGRWEEVSYALQEEEKMESLLSVNELQGRWAYLKPFVKHEFEQGVDKKRKCGHTCGTCPTRPSCQLHEAVDIEDLF
jgi:hypothetical protein